jgi:hypothetical protein
MAASPRVPDNIGNLKFPFMSNAEGGIVAFAGGGQTNATQLGAQTNTIATCATNGDSVKLPKIVSGPGALSPVGASRGAIICVFNAGAANATVYGASPDTINGVATATGVTLPAGTASLFIASGFTQGTGVGTWIQTTPNSVASGALVGSSLTGTATPFPIAGLAAAQGGAVSVTGGTSSTSGNAGGAVSVVGGTPGATGVGGAVSVTGAAGGATSGTGGAVTIAGGAGTNGNAVGGAVSLTGGAGQGTAAGATASVTGGASGAGATGNGGAASLTGGAALSTNGTGGASNQVGGAGAGTGNGGATGQTGGASGAGATGNGGAAAQTGGAALSTNGNGGACSMIGGAGSGTGAGGAITVTSGAAGATGVAGAIAIAVGAATAGNGSAITITSGNGAGGTASGGHLNLVPGAAVSTGTPGEVQVNGNSQLIAVTLNSIGVLEVVTRTVHVCTRPMRFKAFSASQATASTSGTVTVEKLTGTTAPGSGTALLTGTVSMSGTANTVVSGTPIATVASLTFAAGDRVGFVFAGTMTNLVGWSGTALFAPC